MKILSGFIGFLSWAFLLMSGVGLMVLGSVPGVRSMPWFDMFRDQFALQFGVGVLLLLLAFLWPISLIRLHGRSRYLKYQTPGGLVWVSLDAVRDFLAKSSAELPHVVSVKPEVTLHKDTLRVDCACRVVAGAPVPDIARELQDQIRAVLRDNLGLAQKADVRVTVREIRVPTGGAKIAVSEITVRPPRQEASEDDVVGYRNGDT